MKRPSSTKRLYNLGFIGLVLLVLLFIFHFLGSKRNFDFTGSTSSWNTVLPPLSRHELATLHKDCDAEALVRLFNTEGAVNVSAALAMTQAKTIFEQKTLYSYFLKSLSPWILAEPSVPLTTTYRKSQTDCTNPKFSNMFTGEVRASPRPIVDIVLFAYDLDLLEIRLLELYDSIDYFILYEAPFTHQGIDKPLFFNLSRYRSPARWEKYLDKLIHIIVEHKDLAKELDAIRKDPSDWGLDYSNRRLPMKRLKQPERMDKASAANTRKLLKLIEQDDDALIITADDDEQIFGDVLHQVRHCQFKPTVTYPLYFPCVYFKNNLDWVLGTRDLDLKGPECFQHGDYHPAAVKEVMGHLWVSRPKMTKLSQALQDEHLVLDFFIQCHDNVGFPSSWHMSDIAEPVLWWYKKGGVIERHLNPSELFTPEFLAAAKKHQVTPALLAESALQPYCHWRVPAVHVSDLSPAAQDIIQDAVPWAIRENPGRYCWIDPHSNAFAADARRKDFDSRCPAKSLSQHWRLLVIPVKRSKEK